MLLSPVPQTQTPDRPIRNYQASVNRPNRTDYQIKRLGHHYNYFLMDFFYQLRSLKHHASYSIGKRSILRSGIPQCDLTPKDRAYFEQLRDDEKQRYIDETEALKALAEGQQYHAARLAQWGQYQTLNDGFKAHQLGTKLDRKIAQAKHAGIIAEKKRTHRELLAATREANDRAKYRTVNVHSQTVPDESAQHEQQQGWG